MQESTGGHGSADLSLKKKKKRAERKEAHNAGVKSGTDKCASLIIETKIG